MYQQSVMIAEGEASDKQQRKQATAIALRLKAPSEIDLEEYYPAFLDMIRNLLDGKLLASKFVVVCLLACFFYYFLIYFSPNGRKRGLQEVQKESKSPLMTRKLDPAVNETSMGLHEALITICFVGLPQTISPDVNTRGVILKRRKMLEISESFMAPV